MLGKMKLFHWISLTFLALVCSSCSLVPISKDTSIEVGIEEGVGFHIEQPFVKIERGGNAVFFVELQDDYSVTGCSYSRSKIEAVPNGCKITLLKVRYPLIATLSLSSTSVVVVDDSSEAPSPSVPSSSDPILPTPDQPYDPIIADPIKAPKDGPHIRANAPNGFQYFKKEGYLQVGWNTKPDGSGSFIGFGWRYEKSVDKLYAVFEKESDLGLFTFEEGERTCKITAYSGDEKQVVLPSYYNKKPITAVAKGAFSTNLIEELVLSPNLKTVEDGAFLCPMLKMLTFYDRLSSLSNESFQCQRLQTVRINAIEAPCYCGTYWDAFQDKIDYLNSIKDRKKIILFSGSSARYGYDSPMIHDNYPGYEVVNMGVYAYMGAFQQLEVITSYMKEGDILLHAPELDAIEQQFCLKKELDYYFFYCLESGYQELARIDMRRIGNCFSAFKKFQDTRRYSLRVDYSRYAYHYDDYGNYYDDLIYNVYGDMTFYRPNSEETGRISQPYVTYTMLGLFMGYPRAAETLDEVYRDYQDRIGIRVLFSHAPKNIYCLNEGWTENDLHEIDEYLSLAISFPIIMKLEDSLYEPRYFYLIDNHLSSEGTWIRTDFVISCLAPFI